MLNHRISLHGINRDRETGRDRERQTKQRDSLFRQFKFINESSDFIAMDGSWRSQRPTRLHERSDGEGDR
jgi:hypothetical protein